MQQHEKKVINFVEYLNTAHKKPVFEYC